MEAIAQKEEEDRRFFEQHVFLAETSTEKYAVHEYMHRQIAIRDEKIRQATERQAAFR